MLEVLDPRRAVRTMDRETAIKPSEMDETIREDQCAFVDVSEAVRPSGLKVLAEKWPSKRFPEAAGFHR